MNLTLTIELLKTNPLDTISNLSNMDLDRILKYVSHKYYNTATPIISDELFDIILDKMKEIDTNYQLNGISINKETTKTKLPIWMGSMTKIKDITKWNKEYSGPYLLSNKLDGLSCLLEFKSNHIRLYTRGDGKNGQDISSLIPYLNIPQLDGMGDILIRGELVISKQNYQLFKEEFNNERNLVSGIVNSKTITTEAVNYIDYVVYQLIDSTELIKPTTQFQMLDKMGFKVVHHQIVEEINNSILSQYLLQERDTGPYLIDGIIVSNDDVYPTNTSGNPKHSVAFKMVLDDQIAESIVTDVIWTPSKDGYLKPRVRIEPVQLSVKIEYLTGFNGKFILDNNIGIGAIIALRHSGDVIPHITKVIKPAIAKMPDIPYQWNDTNVDVVLINKEANKDVVIKKLNIFFRQLEVKGISLGIYSKLYDSGYTTIKQLLEITIDQLKNINTIEEKSATKIYHQFQKSKEKMTLINLMVGSGIFGRGFGLNRIEYIITNYPNIMELEIDNNKLIEKIEKLDGFSSKTSKQFVDNINHFRDFIKENNLDIITIIETIMVDDNKTIDKPTLFNNYKIVFSGFRDKEMETFIKNNGGKLVNNVSKDTNFLVVKDKNKKSGKLDEAINKEIPIYLIDEFNKKYRL